jgi:hypothetical protein
MRNLNRQLDEPEATRAPESKPFVIWAMTERRRMTDAEIDGAFQDAIASGRGGSDDRPLVLLSQKVAFCELGIVDKFGRFVFRHEELRWITQ